MRSIDCGWAIADCGLDSRSSNPQFAIRNPQSLAGALILALLTPPVGAQQPDSLPTDTLAPVVVTGVRLPTVRELARGLAGRTATLHAADLDARGVRSLADALEQLPGVTTSDELGAPGQLDVTLRGFQVSPTIGLPQGVTVYLDGVRVNEPDAHEVNFDLLPLEDVDHVDVTYGPSVLLGRNSLGAAVNLVTRRGSVPAEREVEVSGGSFGRYELKAHAGDRRGMWDYYLGTRYEHEDGWRAETPSRTATLFGKLGVNTGTWDATLSYAGADNRLHQAASPDSLTESVLTNEVDVGAFVGANWPLVPALTATIAGRYDYVRVPFQDLLDPGQSGLNIFRRLSPRVGFTWSAGSGHELFWSVSRGFRAPALVEIGCADPAAACPLPFALGPDPALRPVIATTYESGWHFRGPGGHGDLSADAFWADVSDDIFFVASTLTAG